MSWHSVTGTAQILDAEINPETGEILAFAQVSQTETYNNEVVAHKTNVYLHFTDGYTAAHLGVGCLVFFNGSIISVPTVKDEEDKVIEWGGNPQIVDGEAQLHIECYTLNILSDLAQADREDGLTIKIMGRLTRNLESATTKSGSFYTNANLATERMYPDPNGSGKWLSNTTWIRATAWGARAESMANMGKRGSLTKGEPIWLEADQFSTDEAGNLQTFKRRDDSVGSSYQVRVVAWRFAPGPKSASRPYSNEPTGGNDRASGGYNPQVDEIPF